MKKHVSFLCSVSALLISQTSFTAKSSIIRDYADCSYEQVQDAFKEQNAWGLHTTVDIKDCDFDLITSAEKIKEFAIELCDLIEMCRYGEPQIVNFGRFKEVEGYTLVQLIETSDITAHFVNIDGSAYLDIFSCKMYNPRIVAEFIKEFFKGGEYTMHVLLRV